MTEHEGLPPEEVVAEKKLPLFPVIYFRADADHKIVPDSVSEGFKQCFSSPNVISEITCDQTAWGRRLGCRKTYCPAICSPSGEWLKVITINSGSEVAHTIINVTDERRQTKTDGLTKIYNQAYFGEKIDELDAMKSVSGLVGILDLNHFKEYNDENGHSAGDELLQEAADFLQHLCRQQNGTPRKHDTVARIGGDEFGIIITNIPNKKTAETINRRIKAAIKQSGFDLAYGSAWVRQGQGFTDAKVIADRRMYNNKIEMYKKKGRTSTPRNFRGSLPLSAA